MSIRATRTLLLVAASLPLLSGCFTAAVVGASTGALMLADRRASEIFVMDEGLELRIGNRIGEALGPKVHLNVTSYNRMVLLSGEALDAATRAEAERLAASVANVRTITNELTIGQPSTLSNRANDSLITSKVKGRFIDHNRFPANHVKVVTEAGTVFLMGMVTQAEADAAVEIARTTSGVRTVVRVFEIISADEARRLDGPPAKKAGE